MTPYGLILRRLKALADKPRPSTKVHFLTRNGITDFLRTN
jgi:hypothetical protein